MIDWQIVTGFLTKVHFYLLSAGKITRYRMNSKCFFFYLLGAKETKLKSAEFHNFRYIF